MALSDAEQAQLLAAVLDIQTQLRGPGNHGWPQLGENAQGQDLTLVDAVAKGFPLGFQECFAASQYVAA